MNLSNIWQHPKTSVVGVLIAIMTIAGVLSQQGVTLGNAGTGTVVALISAIAAALLGLLAKDPGDGVTATSSTSSTTKLGALALCALTLSASMTVGCTQQQKISVAQEIVNWSPSVTSAVNTISATAALLAPQYAPIFAMATAGFDTLSVGLQAAAKDYLADPSQTNLAFLQAEIIKFQQSVNTSLLQIAGIKDANSQKLALAAINGLATIVNTVLGLVQSVSSKAQVAAMAAQVHVTLAQVRPLLDQGSMQAASQRVSQDLALSHAPSVDEFFGWEAQRGF